jgi:hypothetical protein
MKILARLASVLCLVCISLLIAALSIGSLQPTPSVTLLDAVSTYPDGSPCEKPCLFGARRGNTYFYLDILLILLHPFSQLSLASTLDVRNVGDRVAFVVVYDSATTIYLEAPNMNVFYMEYSSRHEKFTLGQVLLFWGQPDHMRIEPAQGNFKALWLSYPTKDVEISFLYRPGNQLIPQDAYNSILVLPESHIENNCGAGCQPWKGFIKVPR